MRLFALCAASVEGLASEKWYTDDTDGTDRPDGMQKPPRPSARRLRHSERSVL